MNGLTDRQLEVLRFIARQIEERGIPADDPRDRRGAGHPLHERRERSPEGARAQGLPDARSREVARAHPDSAAREVLGERRRRSNVVPFATAPAEPTTRASSRSRSSAASPPASRSSRRSAIEDTVQVDSFLLGTNKKVYGLRGAGRLDDRRRDPPRRLHLREEAARRASDGEIVVAMIDDEATVKRVYFEGDRVRFQPSNPRMAPIYVRASPTSGSTMILGVVVGVYRKLG